jgi:transcriptional regulator with XRE-family HTH domain
MSDKKDGGLPPSGFGPLLRAAREGKFTQKELGDAAGVHPNTIARLERGEVEPSWQMVLALSKALGVDCTAFSAVAPPAGQEDEPDADASAKRAADKGKPKGKGKK